MNTKVRTLSILILCTILFCLRVSGQLLVEINPVTWLPEPRYWDSGLLPYPLLLFGQILVMIYMVVVCRGLMVDESHVSRFSSKTGRRLVNFAMVYAGVMFLRALAYVYFLARGTQFLGSWIPIVFHFVLAGFVCTLGRHCQRTSVPS